LNGSIQRFIAEHHYQKTFKAVLLDSLLLRILISSLVFLLLLFSFNKLLFLIHLDKVGSLAGFSLCFVFFISFSEFFKSAFAGMHNIKYNFILNFAEFFSRLSFLILFIYLFDFTLSLNLVLVAFACSVVISSFFGLFFYFKKIKLQKDSFKFDFKKEILSYSFPLFFISLGFLLLTEVDIFMIGLLSTSIEVSYYSVAKQIIIKLPQITLALAMGTLPIFAKINSENKYDLKKKFNKLLKINLFIFSPIIIFLFIFSPYFIPFLYGTEYSASVLLLRILLPYLFFYSFSILLSGFLDYVGKAKKRAINLSVTMIINIVLNYLLIPKYGAVGAALATTISYLPYIVLNWFEVRKILN